MEKLFAYCVGEFGWTLFCWQGILRSMSENYDKVYVAGRPGHEIIYKDFAEYIPLEGIGNETSGMRNKDYDIEMVHKSYNVDDVIYPETYLTHYYPPSENRRFKNTEQKFIKYGKRIYTDITLLIHARFTNKWDSGYRNWSTSKWDMLVENLLNEGHKIGAIGKTGQAYLPSGCYNLMDIDLEDLTNYMRSAKAIIGPSSGPMHLASLCDLNKVTWGSAELEKTYRFDWNPFNVPVNFITGWNPTVNIVKENVEKMLKNNRYDSDRT